MIGCLAHNCGLWIGADLFHFVDIGRLPLGSDPPFGVDSRFVKHQKPCMFIVVVGKDVGMVATENAAFSRKHPNGSLVGLVTVGYG